MYNYSGIYYEMNSSVVVYSMVGILFLLLSKCWNPQKREFKKMIGGILCIVLSVASIVYYSNIIRNPIILAHEGYISREHRTNRGLFQMEYSFTNDEGRKPVFFLDVFSKKVIHPEDFDSQQKYKIYYEDETNIIVRVEKIE